MDQAEISKNSLIIIDGYGFVFRAYHVQPPLLSPDGTPVGALYGFTSMLLKLISDFKPTKAVVVLDSGAKNFRHDLYKEYKANRPPAPEDLVVQLKLIREAAESLNFPVLEKVGFEADDIIATLASVATEAKKNAVIVSSDKDLMQLMNHHVKIYDPAKGRFLELADVEKKFCVGPDKVREVQALMGDKSDNIPGVAGIGPKTAAQLIEQFNDLEGIYASLDQVKSDNQRKKLMDYKEDAFISYELVGLDHNVAIDTKLDELTWTSPENAKISDYLNKYGFKSLHKRAGNIFGVKIDNTLSVANTNKSTDKGEQQKAKKKTIKGETVKRKIEKREISSVEELEQILAEIDQEGIVAVSWIKEDKSDLMSIAYDVAEDKKVISIVDLSMNAGDVKIEEKKSGENFDLFEQPALNARDASPISIADSPYYQPLRAMLEDASIMKITYDLKNMLKMSDIKIRSTHDLMLMDYTLHTGESSKDLYQLLSNHLDLEAERLQDNPANCCQYFHELFIVLKSRLLETKLYNLYIDLDLPVCSVLRYMEEEGIRIDIEGLRNLSIEFEAKAKDLERKIIVLAGEEFNVGSPKQLGEILFEKLSLPYGKTSGKSGAYTTSSEILEKLSLDGHKIADLVLDYRHYTKLKNTYTDSLPGLADRDSSRIHTTYSQSQTTTGRLSSKDPNVQNIPIRSEEGNKIRACFIAKEGYKLISADYSQIELRILSHVADIPELKQAFIENKDIHSQTASQIFAIDIDKVDSEMRRKAKAINFGIIYGISAFGLAKQINCSRSEAGDYIKKYFQEYPGIEAYMSDTIEYARKAGYVENMLGRRCYVSSINSKNHALKSYAERAAINAPLQSLNSDIVKIAMRRLDRILHTKGFKTKMLLQIHDELIFEAPEDEVVEISSIIKSTMEGAITMSVPAIVEVRSGDNWQQIH